MEKTRETQEVGFKDYLDNGGWMGPEAGRRWSRFLNPGAICHAFHIPYLF